jgi:hypothetical protein
MLKVLTGIMVVITITLITTGHTVVLLTGMVTIGMHGDPTTTDRDTGFITPLILIQNPTGITVAPNLTAMVITTLWSTTALLVVTMDTHMHTLDFLTIAIPTDTTLTQVLIIITIIIRQVTLTLMLPHTTQVVLVE